ncbi:MAG: tRNA (guanosine(37)-N1)-methyltransferase TrmD [Lachnospiraceae bacterium]|nr:tRNA (guanosine(37)-N1)-methyltransferase TrmD [Lachnospiraceae bacterium]
MNYHVLTLFPEMILTGLNTSIIGRAIENGSIRLEAFNIRDYSDNKHGKVDDYPYGGGAGMVMQAEPVYQACEALKERIGHEARVIYVTPQGSVFNQSMAQELAREEDLIFLCGHYEGVDERVLEEIVTDFISIGDYVLTGGELPAMVMIDAISRLVPGVLNNADSAELESFHDNLLEYPQYSRPKEWRGKEVPPILLSGAHESVEDWRREQSILRTKKYRPDLYHMFQKEQKQKVLESKKPSRKKLKGVLFTLEAIVDGQFLRPYLKEIFTLVKEEKLFLGLISEQMRNQTEQILRQDGIREMIDLIICKEESEEEKSRADLYLLALKESGLSRKELLVFEGTRSGVHAAKEAGIRIVYLSDKKQEKKSENLSYYKKIFDFVEGMALIRKL